MDWVSISPAEHPELIPGSGDLRVDQGWAVGGPSGGGAESRARGRGGGGGGQTKGKRAEPGGPEGGGMIRFPRLLEASQTFSK